MLEKIRVLSSLIPIIFFVLFCKKKATKEYWVFFLYLTISSVIDLVLATSLWATNNRYLLWNFYGFLENVLLSYFFYLIIRQRFIRILIPFFCLIYLVVFLLNHKSNNTNLNSYMSAFGSVTLLILCVCYFINSMKSISQPVNIFSPIFIIVVALLFNVSSTMFLNIIANMLTSNQMKDYWVINNYSIILLNFIIATAFLKLYFQQKSIPPENHSLDFTSPK